MKIYIVYVEDAADWDRECPDSEGVFFGIHEPWPYVHQAEGGTRPSGHLVVKGWRNAIAMRDRLNKSGDWTDSDGNEVDRPWYAIKEASHIRPIH